MADHTRHGHIIIGHPEMRAQCHLVGQANTSPLCIRTSASSTDCRKCFGVGQWAGMFVAVVVDITLGYREDRLPIQNYDIRRFRTAAIDGYETV